MRWILVVSALIALTLAVFALWPGVDLAVAHFFYDRGGFAGRDGLERFGRDFFRIAPFVVLAAYVALYALRRAGVAVFWAPTGLGVIFLIATIAIGPGLIVNLGLKDHAHRPRPVHVVEFGGPDEFRPWYRFDGACKANCSFVSGEAAPRASGWSRRPCLAPPPARAPAVAGALVFGAAASVLRMAFGGHFLSDVLLGGLISLLVVVVARRLLWPKGGP